jgi:hypothetical protein
MFTDIVPPLSARSAQRYLAASLATRRDKRQLAVQLARKQKKKEARKPTHP